MARWVHSKPLEMELPRRETNEATQPAGPPANPARAAPRQEKWENPWKLMPARRWAVQAGYLVFLSLVGFEFATWVSQVTTGEKVTALRPPSVEAFLPISALLGLKRFLLTGNWDEIHPAGLTILVAALVCAFAARKAFCGWICPVGTVSRVVETVADKLIWKRRWPKVPRWLDLTLSSLKYLLAGFFLYGISMMPLQGVEAFMRAPYNIASDAKMLAFFQSPSTITLLVVGVLVALSFVVKHFWCRFLCPYGALLGVASLGSPLHIRRNTDACNDCGACTRACPMAIPVARRQRVISPDCTGCLSCVAACPVKDALGVTRKGPKTLSPWTVPIAALAVMFGAYVTALATGNWQTQVPLQMFQMAYRAIGIGG